ncbi:hypothetical protein CH371_20025 [Leptospira wolffii]|uniref:Uncharacterized protein n=1 Tax=Leptospira wolffii TaxID=409998 RepID=A0A2M9Z6R6_9LEPT|nr:hypothetical protein CH371_20025 [Leptospira wolffii]
MTTKCFIVLKGLKLGNFSGIFFNNYTKFFVLASTSSRYSSFAPLVHVEAFFCSKWTLSQEATIRAI